MKNFLLFSIWLLSLSGFAQKNDSIHSKPIAFSVKANIGWISSNKIAFTDTQWERMTPSFQVPDSFQVNSNGVDQFGTAAEDFLNLFSFSFVNNKEKAAVRKYRFSTTIHVGRGPEAQVSGYWFHETRNIVDTLISNQTGNPYYVVGNRRQDIQKYYRVRSVMIGVGERFALRPDRIFQFETGLDVFFLIATPSEVKSSLTESYRLEGVNESNYTSPISAPGLNSPQISEYSAKMSKGLLISVPLDISFALSKKSPFWKRVRLGFEVNYGLAFQFTKGKTSYNESRSAAFNLRYDFMSFRRHFLSKRQKPVSN